jgi:hypothetical protein
MATNGSTDTQIISGVNGSGTYLPLSIYTNNALAGQFDTSGNLSVTGSVNMGSSFLRNRIINGDMVIDQRNNGASVTPNNSYTLDRWLGLLSQTSKFTVQQNAGSVTPPAGFTNYLGVTSSSAYSVLSGDFFGIMQFIEGYNIADLAWGTANARTITISFWVRSSLTGTFGGSLRNSAANRSYPFSYTINAANTWEQKTVTIAGDTTGTWLTNNGVGVYVNFSLGAGSTFSGTAGAWSAANLISATGATSVVGTSSATFYITGVQLEVGSTATPFERRLYGQELINCQRYYYKLQGTSSESFVGSGYNNSTTNSLIYIPFLVQMRTSPSAMETTGTANNYALRTASAQVNCSIVPSISSATQNGSGVLFTVASGLSSLGGTLGMFVVSNAYLAWSAEV